MTNNLEIIPPIIAHRGASGYAPENTLSAFKKVEAMGIKWVEFDVVQVACDELIVFHDETLDRTTNGKGPVFLKTYEQLQALDAGAWFNTAFAGEAIPTLADVLSFLAHHDINANIEIKCIPGSEDKVINKLLTITENFSPSIKIPYLFSSFSIEALQHLRQHSSTVLIGLLLHEWLPNWQKLSGELDPVAIHVNHKIVSQKDVNLIKAMDKKMFCYTVNNIDRAQQLFAWGVDAIFSDYPDKMLAALKL